MFINTIIVRLSHRAAKCLSFSWRTDNWKISGKVQHKQKPIDICKTLVAKKSASKARVLTLYQAKGPCTGGKYPKIEWHMYTMQ